MGIVSKSGCHQVSDGCAGSMVSLYLIKSDCSFHIVSDKITRRFCAPINVSENTSRGSNRRFRTFTLD
jgi:hypothetical protein